MALDRNSIKRYVEEQSKAKLIFGAVIVVGLIILVFFNPRDKNYMRAVAAEVEIAKRICLNAANIVQTDTSRLKIGNNTLNDIPVDGKIPVLRYVEYPKVMFFRNGFARHENIDELFCTFKDPRGTNEFGSGHHYYDYKTSQWKARTRTRL